MDIPLCINPILGHEVKVAWILAGHFRSLARPIRFIPNRTGFRREKMGSGTLGVNTLMTPHRSAVLCLAAIMIPQFDRTCRAGDPQHETTTQRSLSLHVHEHAGRS